VKLSRKTYGGGNNTAVGGLSTLSEDDDDNEFQFGKDTDFGLNLDKLDKLNIVHGDINFKNIVFTKKRIFLIDWEPVLIKRINKNFFLKSTFPYYSFSDLKSKKITRKTDLIGFLFLSERLFSGKVNTFNFSKLKNDKWLEEYTKIKNYIFFKLTFIEIYDLVRLKYKT